MKNITSKESLKKQIKQDSISLTKRVWESSNVSQRKELLKAMGWKDLRFAEIGKTSDLTKKFGGGMILSELKGLIQKWKQKNPGTQVKFKGGFKWQ